MKIRPQSHGATVDRLPIRRLAQCLILTASVAAAPALAQTTPTSDPLRGERRLLPLDDLVVTQLSQTGPSTFDPPVFQVGYGDQKKIEWTSSGSGHFERLGATQNLATGVVAGKMFARPKDTFVVAADDLTLIVAGPEMHGTATFEQTTVPLPHLLPAPVPGTAAYEPLMAMADFNGDGYDELVIGSRDNGLQVATPVDLNDPAKGLRWGDFLSPVFTIPGAALTTGDFDGDGGPEVALAYPSDTSFRVEIYHVDPTGLWLSFAHSVTIDSERYGLGSFKIAQVSITAGEFDRDLSDLGLPDEELVATVATLVPGDKRYAIQPIQVFSTLQPVPSGGIGVEADLDSGCSSCTQYVSAVVDSGRLDWTDPLEQIVVGVNMLSTHDLQPWSQIRLLTFDGSSDLKLEAAAEKSVAHVSNGGENCYSGLRGLAIGNFDHPAAGKTAAIPAFQQIGYLVGHTLARQVGGSVCTGSSDPTPIAGLISPDRDTAGNWSLSSGDGYSLNSITPHGPGQVLSMVAADFQGGSLVVGPPQVVQLDDLAQLEVVLQAPPMHLDFIQPIGESSADLLNLSFGLPGFNTRFTESSGTTTSTAHESTTSQTFAEKESTNTSVSFGVPEVASVSVDLKASSQQTQAKVVSQSATQIMSTVDSLTSATDLDDRLWYTQQDVTVYLYPVLCPADASGQAHCASSPTDVVFSIPSSQELYSFVPGATVEWYQPSYQVAQALSYPWSKTQLEALFPGTTLDPKLDVENLPAAGPLATTFQWTDIGETTKSIGKTRTLAYDTSISVSADANATVDIFNLGAKTTETFSFNESRSLSTLTTTKTKIEGSIGFTTNVPDASNLRSGSNQDYAYDFDVIVFGQTKPACDAAATGDVSNQACIYDNPTLDEEVTTQGTLWAGYTVDLSGNWWTSPGNDYFTRHDIGLNHAQRWVRNASQTSGDNCLLDATSTNVLCYIPSPQSLQPDSLWTNEFFQMKGFFVLPVAEDEAGQLLAPQGPQTTIISPDGQVWLQARVHNYSFVATNKNGDGTTATDNRVHVRFYAQEWDATDHVPLAGKPSVLVEEVVVDQCIPGQGGSSTPKAVCTSAGTEANWALVTTSKPFDPASAGIDPGTDGTYVLFWVMAWMEDADGALVPEVVEHGLKALPGTLASLTDAGSLTEAYGNNIGFFHLPIFVCPKGADCSNVGAASTVSAGDPDGTGPALRIGGLDMPHGAVPVDAPVEVRALLTAGETSPRAVHTALYDGDPAADGRIFDVELAPYVRANGSYLIRTHYRPARCGQHDLHVVADPGARGAPVTRTARLDVSVDPRTELAALKQLFASAAIAPGDRAAVARLSRQASRAFWRGRVSAGLAKLADLRSYAGRAAIPSAAAAIEARIDGAVSCIEAAGGRIARAPRARGSRR